MKKIFIILIALLVTAFALAHTEEEYPFTVIVDEDFSGLTEGTEDEPSATPLLDDMGWVIDASAWKPYDNTCTKGWGGDKLFAAGGCLAVVNGFVNTPTGNYSGNLRVSFRARLMNQEASEACDVDILLCRRSKFIDYARKTVTLTHEWATYTLETNTGYYNDCMIQLTTMDDIQYLVDDFKIEHQVMSIEPPRATDAYEMEDDGFTAYWQATADAKDYLLSVYSKTPTPEESEVMEGFDELNVDGTVIVASNPNYPEGWTIRAKEVNTEQFNSAPYSIRLKDDNDYVMTPKTDTPIKSFSFWLWVEDGDQGQEAATGEIRMYARCVHGWSVMATMKVAELMNQGGLICDLSGFFDYFEEIYQMKVEYYNPACDKCIVLIDNVAYEAPDAFRRNFVFEDKVISGKGKTEGEEMECKVTGLDPNTDYYYYVKARNEKSTSEPSNEVEVFDVSNPVALPATEVESDSYVANWECYNKVDFFRVDQLRQLTVEQDNPAYVVLEENFDKVSSYGTAESPEAGEYTLDYYSIDQYTTTGGWTAASTQFGDGMIGGMEKEDGYVAGCIVTPQLDLSHNGGLCDITIRVWGNEGDWFVVQGNNALNYAGINFETTGWVETTIQLPLCTNEERFYMYSNNYYAFMIDYLRITQNLKAGEVVTLVDKSAVVGADHRSVRIEDVDFGSADSDVLYKVKAHRYHNGNEKDIWESPYSELISVKSSADAIATPVMGRENSRRVYDLEGRQHGSALRGIQIMARDGKYVKVLRPAK